MTLTLLEFGRHWMLFGVTGRYLASLDAIARPWSLDVAGYDWMSSGRRSDGGTDGAGELNGRRVLWPPAKPAALAAPSDEFIPTGTKNDCDDMTSEQELGDTARILCVGIATSL